MLDFVIAGYAERFMIPPNKWEELAPKEVLEALYPPDRMAPDIFDLNPGQVVEIGLDTRLREPKEYWDSGMGIAHHPDYGWFILGCGQGPFIAWHNLTEEQFKAFKQEALR